MVTSQKSRRRKRPKGKVPEHLSIEMILRKSFLDSLKEYLECCSLAGVKQMCDPTLSMLQRILWALVFCSATATICYFLQYIWSDTLHRPLIVTMESSTYPISSIDFPAVAICSNNRISKKALAKFAVEEFLDLADKDSSLEDVEKMILNWGRLINFSFNASLNNNRMFHKMSYKYRNDNKRVEQVMRMLAPNCEDILVKCAWGGAIVDCMRIFSMHRIANRGHCCTFNYWLRKLEKDVIKQTEPGELHGLTFMLDSMLDDYAFPLYATQGFDVLIFDPAHFADPNAGRVIHRICEPNRAVYLELKATKQIATREVRSYKIDTRKCLFHDEDTINQAVDVYSYSTCIVLCRINTYHSLCKCTPYFYALKGYQKGPVCTFENLKCLNKYREKFYYLYPINTNNFQGLELEVQNSLFCPYCLPDCELTQYWTKSFEVPLTSSYENKDYRNLLQANINLTNKSFLSIYHPLPDANLDRLDVVFYWYEILSSIGGFTGVVIGFSVISAVEIIYFCTIRLVTHLFTNYKKYHKH